ncbi:sugar transferase, partial [Shigella flexneri]|uniref:sugar transferase n=1 Tax=Shigella flexneri TaxID=623 RepID=UPI0011BE4861
VGEFSFTPLHDFYLLFKRLFDLCCAVAGILLLIPLTVLVKLACLLTGDSAPILYKQERVGLNGGHFCLWEFRSMVPNAGELLEELLRDEKYRREWEANQKLEHDPRITKVGAFLRKTSLDERPQFLNVLWGEMSLVGPRPL